MGASRSRVSDEGEADEAVEADEPSTEERYTPSTAAATSVMAEPVTAVQGTPMPMTTQPAPGSVAEKAEMVRSALGLEPGPLPALATAAVETLGLHVDAARLSLVERVELCYATLFHAPSAVTGSI